MINNPLVITQTAPTPPAWQPQSDWVSVSGVSNNEINLLVTQSTGLAFSVWLPTGTYTIDWGDSRTNTGCVSGTTYQHQHTTGGTACAQGYNTWKVRIYGAGSQIKRWKVERNTYSPRSQNLPVLWAVFGTTGITTYANTFYNSLLSPLVSSNGLQACNIASFANCTSTYQMFYGSTALLYVNLPSSWGSITNTASMFYNCSALSTITLPASWGSITTTASMFQSCSALSNVNLGTSWGSVTTTTSMFSSCPALSNVTLPASWGSVTGTTTIFQNCYELTTITLPASWGSVTNIASMFSGCMSLTTITLPTSWGSITTIASMFTSCGALSNVILPTSWGSITTTASMFQSCGALSNVILPSSWGSVTNTSIMFYSCKKITIIILPSSWGSVTTTANMFYGCYALLSVTLPTSWGSITTASSMFNTCPSLRNIDLGTSWGSVITTTSQMLSGCENLYSVTLPTAFGAALIDVSFMFNNCYTLQVINNLQFLGSNVTQTTFDSVLWDCGMLLAATFGALIKKINVSTNNPSYINKLTSLRLTNAGSTFLGTSPQIDLAYCSLAAAALNTLFGDLPTVTGGQTIRIFGNPGIAGCTQTIATLKGWIVNSTS